MMNTDNKCPACGAEIPNMTQFCDQCGQRTDPSEIPAEAVPAGVPLAEQTPQNVFCRNCGQQMDAAKKFCKKCGTPMGSTAQQGMPSQQQIFPQPPQYQMNQPYMQYPASPYGYPAPPYGNGYGYAPYYSVPKEKGRGGRIAWGVILIVLNALFMFAFLVLAIDELSYTSAGTGFVYLFAAPCFAGAIAGAAMMLNKRKIGFTVMLIASIGIFLSLTLMFVTDTVKGVNNISTLVGQIIMAVIIAMINIWPTYFLFRKDWKDK